MRHLDPTLAIIGTLLLVAVGSPSMTLAQAPAADDLVRIQVCVPARRVFFDDLRLEKLQNHPQFTKYTPEQLALAPNTIRRVATATDPRVANEPKVIRSYGVSFGEVLNRSGVPSAGHGFMPIRDSTVANQPVYEEGFPTNTRASYIAVSVRLPELDKALAALAPTYWFKLPDAIAVDTFSGWYSPASMETAASRNSSGVGWWHRLVHGGDLPIQSVSDDAPKMRFALVKRRAVQNDPTSDTLPALTTARLTLRTPTSGPEFVYEFVAKTNEAIPSCD